VTKESYGGDEMKKVFIAVVVSVAFIILLEVDWNKIVRKIRKIREDRVRKIRKWKLHLLRSTSPKRAREIMGKNFFGVEEAIQYFGLDPSQDFGVLKKIPFSETLLNRVKDTHILVALFPLSILEIRKKVPQLFNPRNKWFEDKREKFSRLRSEPRWMLLRKKEAPLEGDKYYKIVLEKVFVFPGRGIELRLVDLTPPACAVVYAVLGHYMATGEKLFEKKYVITSSRDSNYQYVKVAFFNSHISIAENIFASEAAYESVYP